MERNTERENFIGLTARNMKEIFPMVISMGLDTTYGLMDVNIMVNGRWIICMGKECLNGLMEKNMLEVIRGASNTVMGNFIGQMVAFFVVVG